MHRMTHFFYQLTKHSAIFQICLLFIYFLTRNNKRKEQGIHLNILFKTQNLTIRINRFPYNNVNKYVFLPERFGFIKSLVISFGGFTPAGTSWWRAATKQKEGLIKVPLSYTFFGVGDKHTDHFCLCSTQNFPQRTKNPYLRFGGDDLGFDWLGKRYKLLGHTKVSASS